MVTRVKGGHLGGFAFARWAHTALHHVFVAVLAMVHNGGADFHLVHLAHGALSGFHVSHVTLVADIDRLRLGRHRLRMALLSEGRHGHQHHNDK